MEKAIKALCLALLLLVPVSCTRNPRITYKCHEEKIDQATVAIPVVQVDGKQVEPIYDGIKAFWEEYINSFSPSSSFIFVPFVDNSVPNVVSVRYEGEVLTAAKAVPGSFAFNYDCKSGELLSLNEVTDLSAVLNLLDDLSTNDWNWRYAFEEFGEFDTCKSHIYDYYFAEGDIYIIVKSPDGRYESIVLEDKE